MVFPDEELSQVSAGAGAAGDRAVAEREGRQLVMLTAQVQRTGQDVIEVALLLNGTREIAGNAQRPSLRRSGRSPLWGGRRARGPMIVSSRGTAGDHQGGERVADGGLVTYLFGPGGSDEHNRQQVVAAYDDVLVGEKPWLQTLATSAASMATSSRSAAPPLGEHLGRRSPPR